MGIYRNYHKHGMKMNEIIPFGKYAGKPLESIMDDRQYVDWLLAQSWFRQRHEHLYTVIINNFAEPSETPEHNAMQAMFLDDQFRLQFALTALARCWVDHPVPVTVSLPVFEVDGVDVQFRTKGLQMWVEVKPSIGDDFPAVMRQVLNQRRSASKVRWCERFISQFIFLRNFSGQGVSPDQFRKMFAASQIYVIFESEIKNPQEKNPPTDLF